MRNLSYRLMVPLSFGAIILFTGLVITVGLMARSARALRADISTSTQQMSDMMAASLGPYVQHDAIWEAYQLITTPLHDTGGIDFQPRTISVIAANHRVFVSSEPDRLPISANLATLGESYRRLDELIATSPAVPVMLEDFPDTGLIVANPVRINDAVVGHIIFEYEPASLTQVLLSQAGGIAVMTAGILALLLPVGVYLGRRAAKPLVDLADCMADLDRLSLDELDRKLVSGNDEIGLLSRRFKQMLLDLQHTRELERSIVRSDRLAALGRLVAGIAHEINNPLAGMLNAINTHHKHGPNDPATQRTIDLLERGLEQIRHTVSALLVEARVNSAPLSPQDIDDILTLVTPGIQDKALRLLWRNKVGGTVPLPSSPVRQVLLNLALNAIEASPDGGRLNCCVDIRDNALHVMMENDSDLPNEALDQLFEPFVSLEQSGTGLGLWVTYQIVEQLGGQIRIMSPSEMVAVEVNLPLQEAA